MLKVNWILNLEVPLRGHFFFNMYNKHLDTCASLQKRIFDKIDIMHNDLTDTKVKLAESEFRIIKEIKNGNKGNK